MFNYDREIETLPEDMSGYERRSIERQERDEATRDDYYDNKGKEEKEEEKGDIKAWIHSKHQ